MRIAGDRQSLRSRSLAGDQRHVALRYAEMPRYQRDQRRIRCAIDRRGGKPRLAFVTPLPPERTGVASYAVELLIELSAHADIELVVAQDTTTLPPALAGLPLRSCAWFTEHGAGTLVKAE